MKERITTPIKYKSSVGENCLLPTGEILENTLQHLSLQALDGNRRFMKLNIESQNAVVQALSILGAYTISSCEGKWNRKRWADEWEKLNDHAGKVVDVALSYTTESNLTTGFKTLFQMLEVGVTTTEDLRKKIKLSKDNNSIIGGTRHTRSHTREDWNPR